jgi:transcriptional regulator with XRE-family HTH domain
MKNHKAGSEQVLKLRTRLGLNQFAFWSRIGITQSGGSRYESGRRIPQSVAILIELAYGNKPLQALKRLRDAR